jgi:hypothetical protein
LASDSSSAAARPRFRRPAGRSNSTIAGQSISITWVQKSRGMLICAGAEARLALEDHAVQHLGHAGRVAHLFLVGDHVLEQLHLLDFLEAALADGLVGRLRRDQQQRRVVPVGGLHGGDEIGDAGAVLGDHHRHLAGGAGVAVGHHAGEPSWAQSQKVIPALGNRSRSASRPSR